jgi:hypothetical protein
MTSQEIDAIISYAYDYIAELAEESYNRYINAESVESYVKRGNNIYRCIRALGMRSQLTNKETEALVSCLMNKAGLLSFPQSALFDNPQSLSYRIRYIYDALPVTSETDPTVPSYVKSITASQITNWNTAYSWGNHSGLYWLRSSNFSLGADVQVTIPTGQELFLGNTFQSNVEGVGLRMIREKTVGLWSTYLTASNGSNYFATFVAIVNDGTTASWNIQTKAGAAQQTGLVISGSSSSKASLSYGLESSSDEHGLYISHNDSQTGTANSYGIYLDIADSSRVSSGTAYAISVYNDGLGLVYNIDSSGNILSNGYMDTKEIAEPATPASGYGRWYTSISGIPSFKDDAGVVYNLAADTFLSLSDVTPSTYVGQAGKLVRVNASPDGLEFVTGSTLFSVIGHNHDADYWLQDADFTLDADVQATIPSGNKLLLGNTFQSSVEGVGLNLRRNQTAAWDFTLMSTTGGNYYGYIASNVTATVGSIGIIARAGGSFNTALNVYGLDSSNTRIYMSTPLAYSTSTEYALRLLVNDDQTGDADSEGIYISIDDAGRTSTGSANAIHVYQLGFGTMWRMDTLGNSAQYGYADQKEIAEPATPATTYGRWYVDTVDSKPKFKTDGGTVYDLSLGSSPGGSPGDIQYNNAGAFGGFGDWDGTTLDVGGTLLVVASTTAIASINIPHGVAPTSPVNGALWTTTSGVFARVNGSTVDLTAGGSSTPGGSDTYLQYNDGGVFGGTAELTYNDATGLLTYAPVLDEASGDEVGLTITPTVNKASGNYIAIKVDVTETALGGGANYLLDLKVGGSSKFSVTNSGSTIIATDENLVLSSTGSTSYLYGDTSNNIFIAINGTNRFQLGTGYFTFDYTGTTVSTSTPYSELKYGTLNASTAVTQTFLSLSGTISQTASALGYKALLINITESATVGDNNFLIDLQIGSSAVFRVHNSGRVDFKEITTPAGTPATGYGYLFIDTSDSKIKFKNDGGTVYDLTSTGSGFPGGANTEIQYNDGGVFGGMTEFTYDDATGLLTYDPVLDLATGNEIALSITPTINKATSGTYTAISIAVTETIAPETTNYFLDFSVVGTGRIYSVDDSGNSEQYGYMDSREMSEPTTPSSSYGRWYVDTADSKPKFKSDGGTVYDLSATGLGSPGGTDGMVQYNDGGAALGGISALKWDDTGGKMGFNAPDAGTPWTWHHKMGSGDSFRDGIFVGEATGNYGMLLAHGVLQDDPQLYGYIGPDYTQDMMEIRASIPSVAADNQAGGLPLRQDYFARWNVTAFEAVVNRKLWELNNWSTALFELWPTWAKWLIPMKFKDYTKALLPSASSFDQGLVYISDEERFAYSDGTSWLRIGVVDDGALTDQATTALNCGNQQQHKSDWTIADVATRTLSVSNFGITANVSVKKVGTQDCTVTISGTGFKFVDLANKAVPATSVAPVLTSSATANINFEISIVDSGLLDSTDRVLFVTVL